MTSGSVLVLGGARSGKSSFAERLAMESGLDRVYIATAEAGDQEMGDRIAHHRARRGEGWRTIEAPDRLEEALASAAGEGRAVLVDCLTLWLSNLIHRDADANARSATLCTALRRAPGLIVIVSNEIGLGLVPETPLGRRFRDAHGRLNQVVAAAADRVVFVAAGLPLFLKGAPV